ncbi:Transport and Golgi organization protein 2 [Arabidopsis thaliana x Arabidopsis arenosa]|uniref:Transport and Golgi organization protein 2 n=1 Tax=Arabidopsis thaliana x Arabidopsis arenosa TaxID=1240361 RepID=A0A8T1ZM25_9BRAS|nr:Transport and Golgi organization protein 2 [Arabidopsis thaliana x Arabidopsis arenosa]
MVIIAFEWVENRPTVLQNRDDPESWIVNAAAWIGNGHSLAGLGNPNGGTWMGCSREGRAAFLLDSIPWPRHPTSRIENLTLEFLKGKHTPDQFTEYVIHRQNGGLALHLVVADIFGTNSLVYICKKNEG